MFCSLGRTAGETSQGVKSTKDGVNLVSKVKKMLSKNEGYTSLFSYL